MYSFLYYVIMQYKFLEGDYMCRSKIKIAVCLLGLLILGCTLSHCSTQKGVDANATESNISKESVAPQKAVADLDGDGIADEKDDDIDGDGLLNRDEETLNSDPFNKDTDGDGKLDGEEAKKDTDKDGFLDLLESAKKDKDNDGVVDELDSDDSTTNNDSDSDGYSNIAEKRAGTNPLDPQSHPQPKDTDKDGKLDKDEKGKDSDGDNKSDVVESAKLDHDNDGVVDELDNDDANPANDSDGDGFSNIDEKNAGTNPLDKSSFPAPKDSDKDGKLDKDEQGKDTDKDGKSDVVESAKLDHDNDGVVDELDNDDANPANDSDGDGFSNIDEKNAGTNPLDKSSFPAPKKAEEANTTPAAEATATKPTPEELKKMIEKEINDILQAENIEFETDSSMITPKGIETIKKIYAVLKKYPNVKIEIAGHTDSDGDAAYNQKLSQERVDMVKKALVEFGLNGDRFTTKGYGESKPLVPNDSPENKAKNRRVEFIIIGE